MRKKIFILISFLVFIGFININAYADVPDGTLKPITVKLNDKILEFDTDPIIVNGRTMVPMRAIFEQLGAQVDWKEETKTITGYRKYKDISNMFIKLKIGDDVAYRNGKSFPLDSPPIIKDDRTLVPIRFIAQSFGIKVDWDSKSRTVLLSYDVDEFQGTKLIGDVSYKPRFFENGLKIMIPEFWNKAGNSNRFGYKDEETNIQMDVDIIGLDKTKTLQQFIEESKTSILNQYKDKVVFTGSDKININNVTVNIVYLKNSSMTPEINQVIYYFTSSGYGYKITFSYYSESNDSQLLNMISNMINTIEVSGVTFNVDNEHYIEYDTFFNYGFTLNSEIYSSMDVQNEFSFKGIINNDVDLDYAIVTVSKEDKKSEYKIPISNHEFESKIYTPFGLGKHNVTIKTPASQKIMQFSVLNTSSQPIEYLVPSMFVEKDDPDIIALSNEITKDIEKKYLSEYDRAEAIFKWIFENIEYDPEANINDPRSAKDVLAAKKGGNEEICYLYAALLRASDIPSKLVKGTVNDEEHTWNEIMVNGRWVIVDVTWGSGYKYSNHMIKELNMTYFKAARGYYVNKFKDGQITTLEY